MSTDKRKDPDPNQKPGEDVLDQYQDKDGKLREDNLKPRGGDDRVSKCW